MNEQPEIMPERLAQTVHDARAAGMRSVFAWFATMAAGGIFLGFVGATDSYDLPLWLRLGFWFALCMIAGCFGLAIEALLGRFNVALESLSGWIGATFAMALAMTPVVFLANSLTGNPPITQLQIYFANSVIISAGLVALRIGLGRAWRQPESKIVADTGTKFMRRLEPVRQQASLYALSSEGHYVRAWTDAGSELVLMRLGDAIGETTGIDGAQVHRGWWVARDAIAERKNVGGNSSLVLVNGEEVPVSRNRRKELRETGWL